jgi:hypothetical protein
MSSGHGPERGRGGVGPWQEFVETALGMAVDDAADDVGQVVVGLQADELAGLDQGSDDGPMFGAAVGAGEECIFPIEGHHPFILPMSGRSWKFITDGTLIAARRFRCVALSSARRASSLGCSDQVGWLSRSPAGCSIL